MATLFKHFAVFIFLSMSVSAASGATLNLVGGSTIPDLPDNFGTLVDVNGNVDRNNSLFGNLPSNTTDAFQITNYFANKNVGTDGLAISGDAVVKFTYLGTEASNTNTATSVAFGGGSFNNKTAQFGDMLIGNFSSVVAPFLLDFAFNTTLGRTASNSGAISQGLTLAFGELFNNNKSIIALFGDGAGDSDLDDIVVRIDVVPLPTALPLFGSALLLMGLLGRRRKRKAA